jgi:hypothetical protein
MPVPAPMSAAVRAPASLRPSRMKSTASLGYDGRNLA